MKRLITCEITITLCLDVEAWMKGVNAAYGNVMFLESLKTSREILKGSRFELATHNGRLIGVAIAPSRIRWWPE